VAGELFAVPSRSPTADEGITHVVGAGTRTLGICKDHARPCDPVASLSLYGRRRRPVTGGLDISGFVLTPRMCLVLTHTYCSENDW
jgi:hypothetical protein